MSEKKVNLIHNIYSIAMSLLVVVIGIICIVCCVSIYKSGPNPFSREAVASMLVYVAPPAILCVIGIVAGIVISHFVPTLQKGKRRALSVRSQLEMSSAVLDTDRLDENSASVIKRERRLRGIFDAVCAISAAAAISPTIVYMLRPDSFAGSDPMREVGMFSAILFTCLAITAAVCLIISFVKDASYSRQLAVTKDAIKNGCRRKRDPGAASAVNGKKTQRAINVTRGVIIAAALVLIVAGIFNGGMRDVLGKAINICRECIGLG